MGNHNSGRRPTPTALKILRGNPGKRPLNQDEPQPPKGPVVKPELSAGADRVWDALAPVCEAMGTLTAADVRVSSLAERVRDASGAERAALATELAEVRTAVRAEKLGEVAAGFDRVHDIRRAVEVGSVDAVISARELRPKLIEAIISGVPGD